MAGLSTQGRRVLTGSWWPPPGGSCQLAHVCILPGCIIGPHGWPLPPLPVSSGTPSGQLKCGWMNTSNTIMLPGRSPWRGPLESKSPFWLICAEGQEEPQLTGQASGSWQAWRSAGLPGRSAPPGPKLFPLGSPLGADRASTVLQRHGSAGGQGKELSVRYHDIRCLISPKHSEKWV